MLRSLRYGRSLFAALREQSVVHHEYVLHKKASGVFSPFARFFRYTLLYLNSRVPCPRKALVSFYLSVYLSICLAVYLSIYLSGGYSPVCLSISRYVGKCSTLSGFVNIMMAEHLIPKYQRFEPLCGTALGCNVSSFETHILPF